MLRNGVLPAFLVVAASALSFGCSSLGGSAVPTGPVRLAPYAGPVAVYAAGPPKEGVELGVVEVHAAQEEANVEDLLPLFLQKVAALGGDAAVIDGVNAQFEIYYRPHADTYTHWCGYRTPCVTTRAYPLHEEVMIVTMHGRAFARGTPRGAGGEGGVR